MAGSIVGREEELRTLRAFVGAAPGELTALVLEGEAGAGKTTLWTVGVDAARVGSRVLVIRPAESETDLSFAAIGDLLDPVLDTVLTELPPPQQRALGVALMREEAAPGHPLDRRAVGSAVLGALRALAAQQAILVAVDDVQWLDAPSAGALAFAVRRLGDEPVGLLLARRLGVDAPLLEELEQTLPAPRLRRIAIGSLDLDDVHHLLHERFGISTPRPILRQVHETSGGNPFFAIELARALDERRIVAEAGEPLPIPGSLGEVLRGRLAGLPRLTLEALFVVAAVSQPTLALVDEAVGAPDVLEAAFAGLIVELDGARIRFAHPLLASAAYDAVSLTKRRVLHRLLADLVDEPEERARHLALAATGPDEAVAAALDAAARHALTRGAPDAAAALGLRARALTPPGREEDARRRAAEAAFCRFSSGDALGAIALLDEILAGLSAGAERAAVTRLLARIRSYDDIRAAEDLYRRVLAEPDAEDAIRVAAHEGVSSCLFRLRERLAEAVDHASAAARLARAIGSEPKVEEALGTQGLVECVLGRADAVVTMRAALAVEAADPTMLILQRAEFPAAVVAWWTDDLDRAVELLERQRVKALQLGDESSLPYILVILAQVYAALGELDLAARHADEGRDIAEQVAQRTMVAYLLAARSFADACSGRINEARTGAEEALELATTTSGRPAEHLATSAIGYLELSLGNPAAAVSALRPLVAFVRAQAMNEPGATRYVTDLIEGLIETGEVDEAIDLLDWFEGNALRLGRHSALATSARCRALLLAAAGNVDGALAAFERALDEHEHVLLPIERARTRLVLGATLRRSKRKREARETLERARSELAAIGALVYANASTRELERIGGRTPGGGGLTPSERRVAELVAAGKTNREVAAALFVSDRTVEGHLSHIYGKLGVRSRTELARVLAAPLADA